MSLEPLAEGVTVVEPAAKRQRVDSSRLQCNFVIAKKQRRCGMTRKEDQEFCAIHAQDADHSRKRVPCPNDGRHSVWAADLKKHLAKCIKVEEADPWFVENLNTPAGNEEEASAPFEELKETAPALTKELGEAASTLADGSTEASPALTSSLSREITPSEFAHFIPVINAAFEAFDPLPFIQHHHASLEPRLDELGSGKHAIQQASLIGHLKAEGLLVPESDQRHVYMEFGCGRAELSRYVNQALLHEATGAIRVGAAGFFLIDRASSRNKLEQKLVKDYHEANDPCDPANVAAKNTAAPVVFRARIDIKDLLLDRVATLPKMAGLGAGCRYVGISKHLCGAATDLTLRCIQNSDEMTKGHRFKGMVVAMCCRHCCDYSLMLPQSKRFLTNRGIGPRGFAVVMKMASWAVSGRRAGMEDDDLNNHPSGLTVSQREEMGFKARRLIDESRRYALEKTGFEVKLCHYVEREVTLENVCLIIKPQIPASQSSAEAPLGETTTL